MNYEGILTGSKQLGPFPMERLKRVEQPTNLITSNWQRVDENGFGKAMRGEFGALAKVGAQGYRFSSRHPLSAALVDMVAQLIPGVAREVAPSKAPVPEDPVLLSRHIKRLGYFLGADIVGICRLPQSAVYHHALSGNPVELNHQFAIVVVLRQEYETMRACQGYGLIVGAQSFRTYSRLALITEVIENYIKRLGYPARAHHPRHYQVVMPPLLLYAGIGEISRIGIVVNPFLGPRLKAAAVTTDFPLMPDKPVDFGLQDFCNHCQKCARECPTHAIPAGNKSMYNGYETWRINVEACVRFWVTNQDSTGCCNCIKVCPWNKPQAWYHRAVEWSLERSKLARRLIVRLDDIMGYGKQVKEEKWWFDLKEVDGLLKLQGGRHR
ncbi:3-chloro-4-hydroxyphenylacetate reductive dehalogenase [subsurface metagenome]